MLYMPPPASRAQVVANLVNQRLNPEYGRASAVDHVVVRLPH
jgi:hypothetical protein